MSCLSAEQKAEIVKEHQIDSTDTGSPNISKNTNTITIPAVVSCAWLTSAENCWTTCMRKTHRAIRT